MSSNLMFLLNSLDEDFAIKLLFQMPIFTSFPLNESPYKYRMFSLLSMAIMGNVFSVGASGAIFGLLGAMLYFGYHYRVYLGNVITYAVMVPISPKITANAISLSLSESNAT